MRKLRVKMYLQGQQNLVLIVEVSFTHATDVRPGMLPAINVRRDIFTVFVAQTRVQQQ